MSAECELAACGDGRRAVERSGEPKVPPRHLSLKAAGDLFAALVLIVPAAPLVALAMALVKLTSRGPVIYSQRRLGLDGRPFTIYKIRTMVVDSEATGPRWSTEGDPRVTRIGRSLRRSHLDELPQLWNILRGEMSLVGPRPERPEIVDKLEVALPRYRERLAVRPGVTGLAQVQLPPDTDIESVRRKLECDLYYVARPSLSLDLRIVVCTAVALVGIPYPISRRLLRIPELVPSDQVVTQLQPA